MWVHPWCAHVEVREHSRESVPTLYHGFQGLSSGCQCLYSRATFQVHVQYFKSLRCCLPSLHCEIHYFVQNSVWWDDGTLNYKMIFMKIMPTRGSVWNTHLYGPTWLYLDSPWKHTSGYVNEDVPRNWNWERTPWAGDLEKPRGKAGQQQSSLSSPECVWPAPVLFTMPSLTRCTVSW